MALISLQQTNITAPCGFAAYCSTQSNTSGLTGASDARSGGFPGTVEVVPELVNSETRVNVVVFSTLDLGVISWGSGTHTVRLNITTGNSSLTWEDTYVCRVNTSCTNQETLGSLTSQAIDISSTGVQTMNITGSSTTALSTDRLVYVLAFSNSSDHGGNDGFGYTPDQLIDTPIDDAADVARRIFIT